MDDRVNVVYSDFSLNWNKATDRAEVVVYCVKLKRFLLEKLSEEEILIGTYSVSHVGS